MEGDNHEQADVQVKLAKMSMSGLKTVCNTMKVDHSLSWDKTTLVDTFMQKLGPEQCRGFGQSCGPTVALRKRRRRRRHRYFHLQSLSPDLRHCLCRGGRGGAMLGGRRGVIAASRYIGITAAICVSSASSSAGAAADGFQRVIFHVCDIFPQLCSWGSRGLAPIISGALCRSASSAFSVHTRFRSSFGLHLLKGPVVHLGHWNLLRMYMVCSKL